MLVPLPIKGKQVILIIYARIVECLEKALVNRPVDFLQLAHFFAPYAGGCRLPVNVNWLKLVKTIIR